MPTSPYSRQKAYVERLVDAFEGRYPSVRVVRLRPGLIFQARAGTEIRRYFAGPFLPSRLLRPGHLALFPRITGLAAQIVHADDAAQAYRMAVTRPVRGAFNIAADPPLDMADMAEIVGARSVPVPFGLARAAASATWRGRLQPTEPGWLDLARGVPLMDTSRAQAELHWAPKRSASEAFAEVLGGAGPGPGHPHPRC